MKPFKNPGAFKKSLEARIKARASERGIPVNRYRQLVIFDRFLARVYEVCRDSVILKGGLVMELRLHQARTTRDIDIRGTGSLDEMIERIRERAMQPGDDYLTFEASSEQNLSEMVGEQIVYEGKRQKFQARLAGRTYGSPFGLDISMADKLVVPPDRAVGDDLFAFIGLDPVDHPIYPAPAHVAEKFHAVSHEREDGRMNTRMKDLVDIGLLCLNLDFNAKRLSDSIEATFTFRGTHPVPTLVPEIPHQWTAMYQRLRKRDELDWPSIAELETLVRDFLDPILSGNVTLGRWEAEVGEWT